MLKQIYSVAVYRTDRRYGGSEEGGWWYDQSERIGKAARYFEDKDAAYAYQDRINARFEREDRRAGLRPIWSVIGDPEVRALVFEGSLPDCEPAVRPYYE
jgi:hypothetical protein